MMLTSLKFEPSRFCEEAVEFAGAEGICLRKFVGDSNNRSIEHSLMRAAGADLGDPMLSDSSS